ncbi:MAG TPA: cytochrome b/b6 domain-containing protein [Rhizomicrobium sp.]|jgi:thiosulfate reductase cytochrome b subunit
MAFLSSAANDAPEKRLVYRHTLWVRISHWINAGALLIMLMSGLQIFNAHPALYWGVTSQFDRPILSMTAVHTADGGIAGITQIGSLQFDTTGIFGASEIFGRMTPRGFPSWATLPSFQWLAAGRLWHFFFAWIFVLNGLAFAAYAFFSRHFNRDLLPKKRDLRNIGKDIVDHLHLRFPKGEGALHYNVLQKLAYFTVIYIIAPLIVLTGLTMSPTMNAAIPQLLFVFGGRQTARTIHFLCAFAFVGFFIIHIVMVILSGPLNNLRAIITGRTAIDPEADHG